MTHKITPFLWFDGQAEEAAKFDTSILKNFEDTRLKPNIKKLEAAYAGM